MLPKLDHPTYNITLPLSGQRIKVRPYLVKEEKLLLMAMESTDIDEKVNLLFQVLQNTITEDLDIRSLPLPDLMYLVTKVRGYSKGEVLELMVTCQNQIGEVGKTDSLCGYKNPVEVNIEGAKLSGKPLDGKISLTSSIGVKLNPPSANFLINVMKGQKMSALSDDMFFDMLEYIWDEDQVYHKRDSTKAEVSEFFDGMNEDQLQLVSDYVDSVPDVVVEFEYTCNACGNTEKVTLTSKDINRFLA